ncbi:MAG: CBS domain-containing protein [Rubrivivax sp.]|nr:CBS domain-containing protein [Rubrivivax sp.]
MTRDVQTVGPQESLQRAAQLMDRLDVGSLLVCDGRKLLGIVTDRDITVRGTALGLAPNGSCVSDVMSRSVQWCTEDQDAQDVMKKMADAQVRRLPVVDGKSELVGIVSVGDVATRSHAGVGAMVREISTPSHPEGTPSQP